MLPILGGLVLTATAVGPAQADKVARHFVQSPFARDSGIGTLSLDYIEDKGADDPVLERRFGLDYDATEGMIRSQLQARIPPTVAGTYECPTVFCPDVAWEVHPTPGFSFTRRNDPVLSQVGASGESRVRVTLDTEARIDINAIVRAKFPDAFILDITGDSDTGPVPVNAWVVLGVHATSEIDLWPRVRERDVDVKTSLVDSNVELQLNGVLIERGAKWGAFGGVLLNVPGGPLLSGLIGALLADEAADAAEAHIREVFSAQVTTAVREADAALKMPVRAAVAALVQAIPEPEAMWLDSQVPGTGMTVRQLNGPMGGTTEVHSVTPSGNLASSAVHRFAPPASNGRIAGTIRFPKEAWRYYEVNLGPRWGQGTLCQGPDPWNVDLGQAVGTPCTDLLDGDDIHRRAFLGADPQRALGGAAEHREMWSDGVGSAAFVGTISDDATTYRCRFEIGGLPRGALLEIEFAGDLKIRLTEDHAYRQRFLELQQAGGGTMLLDRYYDPLDPGAGGVPELEVGGPMPEECSASFTGGTGSPQTFREELESQVNPETCPQCGIELLPGRANIYSLDGSVFARTGIGTRVLEAVARSRKLELGARTFGPQ